MTHTLAELDQIVGGMTEQMNDKMDTDGRNGTSTVDYVVEWQLPTAANNYSWYRKYKSGWIEQGGKASVANSNSWTTINLIKTMSDTNYFISNSLFSDDAYWVNQQPLYVGQRTTTSFLARCNQNTSFVMWEVKGMAAST